MKKVKTMFTFAVVSTFMFAGSAHAQVTDEEYFRLNQVFSDARIEAMTDEEIDKYLSYDLENAESERIFYKGVSRNNGSYTWTEVTEEEYNNSEADIQPYSTTVSTNYKELYLSVIPESSGAYYMYMRNTWKVAPAIRSFDVIAFRFKNISVINGSQGGMQLYKKSGASSSSHVTYAYNGTNIYHQDRGFGISMNLVDDDISMLELSIEAEGLKNQSTAYVYGSYQHATNNVTLAQSKQYTISHNGYGSVVNFSTSMQNKYDGMRGVDKTI